MLGLFVIHKLQVKKTGYCTTSKIWGDVSGMDGLCNGVRFSYLDKGGHRGLTVMALD